MLPRLIEAYQRLPRILYRAITRELATTFLVGLGSLSLIYMIVAGIQGVQAGFRFTVILPWILQSMVYSLYFTVPVSLLVTATLCYGRMAADREYTAVCASGISPLHLFVPLAALSGGLSLLAFATQGTVLPAAHYAQRNIARYLIRQLEHLGNSQHGRLELQGGSVAWRENHGPNLREVQIQRSIPELDARGLGLDTRGDELEEDQEDDREDLMVPLKVSAETAHVAMDPATDRVVLNLINVQILVGRPHEGVLFEDREWPIHYEAAAVTRSEFAFSINEKEKREGDMSSTELIEHTRRVQDQLARLRAKDPELLERLTPQKAERLERRLAKQLRNVELERWERRTLALSCFVFAFVGFPLSLTLRYRHRLVALFSGGMLVVCTFYPLLLLGRVLAETGSLPAWIACSMGNVLLLAVGLVLTGRLLLR